MAEVSRAADFLARTERDLLGGFRTWLVLEILEKQGPVHGYAVVAGLETILGPGTAKEGTIYPLLSVLEKEGLAESAWGTDGPGARRRYYTLTRAGSQARRMARMVFDDTLTSIHSYLERDA